MEIPSFLVNQHFNDRYFDVVDAINEAKVVFFKGTELLDILNRSDNNPRQIIIGETGFGAGRVLVALIDYLDTAGFRDCSVVYNSVELHPLTYQHITSVLHEFQAQLSGVIELFLDAYRTIDLTQPQWNTISIKCPFGVLTLNLWIGEALEMVNALESPCDVWFLDGHGPRKNPAMWRPELLMAIGEKTRHSGTVATYTVAGVVKRGLTSAGFAVEKVPGCGGKKEALRGVKIR